MDKEHFIKEQNETLNTKFRPILVEALATYAFPNCFSSSNFLLFLCILLSMEKDILIKRTWRFPGWTRQRFCISWVLYRPGLCLFKICTTFIPNKLHKSICVIETRKVYAKQIQKVINTAFKMSFLWLVYFWGMFLLFVGCFSETLKSFLPSILYRFIPKK